MDEMISLYIDDEMDLDEKIAFVRAVQKEDGFAEATVGFLSQEKLIRGPVTDRRPMDAPRLSFDWRRYMRPFFRPMGLAVGAFAAIIVFLIFFMPPSVNIPHVNRFVIYRPDVSQVEITGTFTDWQRIPMTPIGHSGYWEISLSLSAGEHRFSYILEGHRSVADPTIPTREKDDFGSENSVLYVEQNV